MSNPVMSMWLSAFNSAAGQARGFWTAEMHRQQTAAISEMARLTIRFWTQVWQLPISGR